MKNPYSVNSYENFQRRNFRTAKIPCGQKFNVENSKGEKSGHGGKAPTPSPCLRYSSGNAIRCNLRRLPLNIFSPSLSAMFFFYYCTLSSCFKIVCNINQVPIRGFVRISEKNSTFLVFLIRESLWFFFHVNNTKLYKTFKIQISHALHIVS